MRILVRLSLVAGLALALAGCDKCGDWFGQGKPKACQTTTPR